MDIVYCIVISLVCFILIYTLYQISKYFSAKSKSESITTDMETLKLMQVLQPWIQQQVEKATEFVIQKYMVDASRERIKKTLTSEQYFKLIYDIQSHFYGSIPMAVNQDYLFKYIDKKQIDVLIVSAFRIYNDNFFTIQKEE